MPCIDSSYRSPLVYRQCDVHTILPSIIPHASLTWHSRKEIRTKDGDYLDTDWLHQRSPILTLISHGLEGSSSSVYVRSLARACEQKGWDVCAWNFRGCSGRINNAPYYYHSGLSEDLRQLIEHIDKKNQYHSILLVGFSIGGNITLKYLGEQQQQLPTSLKASVCWSAPVDLESSASELARPSRALYQRYFIQSLKQKIENKAKQFPDTICTRGLEKIKDFYEFDRRYTAPMHGFSDEREYWKKSSSKPLLPSIELPTLLVNALDDPFLAPESYPFKEADSNRSLFLETPKHGGHVAFMLNSWSFQSWINTRTLSFLSSHIVPGQKLYN